MLKVGELRFSNSVFILGFLVLLNACAGPQVGGLTGTSETPEPTNVLTAPSDLAATAVAENAIDLSWRDNSTDEDGFLIERSLSSAFTSVTQMGATASNSVSVVYHDTELVAYTTYFYRVKAISRNGGSAFTAAASTRTNAPSNCSFTLGSSSMSFSGSASTALLSVTTQAGCAWTAVSNSGFVSISAGATGIGSGSVSVTVTANTSGSTRSGSLTVAGQAVSISQTAIADTTAPAVVIGSPTSSATYATVSSSVSLSGTASDNIGVTAVTWTNAANATSGSATGTTSWSISSINLQSGSNLITVTARDAVGNTSTDTLVVTYTPCTYSISPSSASVAATLSTGTFSIATQAGCSWTAVSNAAAYLTITSGASGSGNGTVAYSITANSSASVRMGTITAAGQTFSITQAGSCSYTLNPTSVSVSASASTGNVAMTTGPSCSWAASSMSAFVTLTSASSGTGSATVTYSVAANSTVSARTGNLLINGITFPITQSAAADTVAPSTTITSPTSAATYSSSAATLSLAGTASDNVGVTSVTWANSSNGTSGTAVGTTSWSIAAISLVTGSNSITVTARDAAGNTATDVITVTFSGCTYSLSKSVESVAAGGLRSYVNVTAPSGCAWTSSISSDPNSILTLTSGQSATGAGAVSYRVSENTTVSARSSTITIGGQTLTLNQAATLDTGSPQNLVGSLSSGQVQLTWQDRATNELSFAVDIASEIRPWQWTMGLTGIAPNAVALSTSIISGNASYYYRVRGIYSSGTSRPSNTVLVSNAVTSGGAIPSAPTALAVRKNLASEVSMTWSSTSSNELGFRIERATGSPSGFQYIGSRNKGIRVFFDSSVVPGTTYYYRVKAFGDGGDSAYSNNLSVSVPSLPADVQDSTAQWLFVLVNNGTAMPAEPANFFCSSELISTSHAWLKSQTAKYGVAKPIGQIRCASSQLSLPGGMVTPTMVGGVQQPLDETQVMSYILANVPEAATANYISVFYYMPSAGSFSFHTQSSNFAFNYLHANGSGYHPNLSISQWGELLNHELLHLLGASDKYLRTSTACTTDASTGFEVDGYDIMCHRVGDSLDRSLGFLNPGIDRLIVSPTTAYELGWSASP